MTIQIYSVILAVLSAIVVQGQQQREIPQPYSYSYQNAHEYGGGSFHTSTGGANGRVTGSYGLNDVDGRQRVVDYIADELGFRATVTSNEPGVDASFGSPADVLLRASGGRPIAAQPQPVAVAQPLRRVPVRPQQVYQPVRPVPAVTRPTGSYRVVSVPRNSGGYRVVEAPRQVEYVYARPSYDNYARPSYVNYGPYY